MWWSRATLVIVIAALVASCGFRPMYGRQSDGDDVLSEFATIEIAPIPDRLGQLTRNNLLDLLTPRGEPVAARYRLKVNLTARTNKVAVERTGLSTRANYRVNATFALIDQSNNEQVLKGKTLAVSSYNIVKKDFSVLAAEQDAKVRVSRRIAEQIRNRLGGYFTERRAAAAAAPR